VPADIAAHPGRDASFAKVLLLDFLLMVQPARYWIGEQPPFRR
jgi:hypothetical protein